MNYEAITNLEELNYEDLKKMRNQILEEVYEFEKTGGLFERDYDIEEPSSDTIYKSNLLALSRVCEAMSKKYAYGDPKEKTQSIPVIKE